MVDDFLIQTTGGGGTATSLIESDGVNPTISTASHAAAAAATANVDFVTKSKTVLAVTNILTAGFAIVDTSCNLIVLRDAVSILTQSLISGQLTTFSFLDQSVSLGSHNYSIRFSLSCNGKAFLSLTDESLSSTSATSSPSTSMAFPNAGGVTAVASAILTLSKTANGIVYYWGIVGGIGGNSYTVTVYRDSTLLYTNSILSGSIVAGSLVDSAVPAGTRTYQLTIGTTNSTTEITVISNGR